MDFQAARTAMVKSQLRPNGLTDDRVAQALEAVPRERFLPKSLASIAYVDEDLPLGNGRYLIEPVVLARMLQAASIGENETVLDVGCATGYGAAVLARLANTVVALECEPELAARATDVLASLEVANAAVVEGPLDQGLPDQGPFDVILIEGAVAEVPAALLQQVAEDGRLVAVVRRQGIGVVTLYGREHGAIGHRSLYDAATPLLPGFEPKKSFVF